MIPVRSCCLSGLWFSSSTSQMQEFLSTCVKRSTKTRPVICDSSAMLLNWYWRQMQKNRHGFKTRVVWSSPSQTKLWSGGLGTIWFRHQFTRHGGLIHAWSDHQTSLCWGLLFWISNLYGPKKLQYLFPNCNACVEWRQLCFLMDSMRQKIKQQLLPNHE